MEILSPIKSADELEGLADNILDIEEMCRIRDAARKCNARVFVTLNRYNYPPSCYSLLEACIEDLLQIGLTSFIVTDISLVHWLHEMHPEVTVVLSTCAMSLNTWSSTVYADLGVQRITFPRHMSVRELETICTQLPHIEFECFLLDQGCQYDDGHCNILHGCGAICREQWTYEYFRADNKPFSDSEMQALYENEFWYTRWLRPYPAKDYMINNWGTIFCAICQLPRLAQLTNLNSVKITGRAKSLDEKEQLVRFTRQVLTMVDNGAYQAELRTFVQNQWGSYLCENQQRCYMKSTE